MSPDTENGIPGGGAAIPEAHLEFRHVVIDGSGTKSYSSPRSYELAVAHQLRRIHHTRTGRAVMHEFGRRTAKRLRITPYEGDKLNATTTALDIVGATPAKSFILGGNGFPLRFPDGRTYGGTGTGSDAVIAYTPLRHIEYCSKNKTSKAGSEPDETLIHELVHATRIMRGVFVPGVLGDNYDSYEEFYAILIANIYASETGRQEDLRANHLPGGQRLPKSLDSDAEFLPKNDERDYKFALVKNLVTGLPGLAAELRKMDDVPFNPVRRYFELLKTKAYVPSYDIPDDDEAPSGPPPAQFLGR